MYTSAADYRLSIPCPMKGALDASTLPVLP
jgi:hypothetical protein